MLLPSDSARATFSALLLLSARSVADRRAHCSACAWRDSVDWRTCKGGHEAPRGEHLHVKREKLARRDSVRLGRTLDVTKRLPSLTVVTQPMSPSVAASPSSASSSSLLTRVERVAGLVASIFIGAAANVAGGERRGAGWTVTDLVGLVLALLSCLSEVAAGCGGIVGDLARGGGGGGGGGGADGADGGGGGGAEGNGTTGAGGRSLRRGDRVGSDDDDTPMPSACHATDSSAIIARTRPCPPISSITVNIWSGCNVPICAESSSEDARITSGTSLTL